MRIPKLKFWLDKGVKRIAINGFLGLNISEISDDIKIAKSSIYF
jgi:hypothetical protein